MSHFNLEDLGQLIDHAMTGCRWLLTIAGISKLINEAKAKKSDKQQEPERD